ncbi:MAG: hypothetical protein COB85_00405 [Bacteroidetes bacterium]|nr:MAG: hypothetical protein COB85_00405 [Bacteroidota bacterium]
MAITKEQVLEALSNVEDPDLHKDLVTLGMIEDVEINGKEVSFTVVLTTPACPMKEMIQRACENAIIHYVDKEAEHGVWKRINNNAFHFNSIGLRHSVKTS